MSGLVARELSIGLWLWEVVEPAGSGRSVASVYFEAPSHVVLIDPVLPADGGPDRERFLAHLERDLGRVGLPLAVVLTSARGVCDSAFLEERYGATVDGESADERREIISGVGAILLGDGRSGRRIVTIPAHRAVFCGEIISGRGGGALQLGPGCATSLAVEDAQVRLVEKLRAFAPQAILVAHGESVLANGAEAIDSLLGDGQGFV